MSDPSTPKLSVPQALALGILVAVSFFAGLGAVPLFDKDEGAFSAATRHMVESGNYVMTYLNGQPRYDKPILIYWLQAASIHMLGLNEFALRFPSAVAAAVWVGAAFFFARRYYGVQVGFLAAVLLASSVQTTIIGKAAIADALLNMCIAIAMFSAWRYIDTGRKRPLYVAFAAAGLGMLTKGPVAILVPALTTLLFYVLRAPWKRGLVDWLRDALNPVGLLIIVAINLPWYALAVYDQGWPILEEWIQKQLFERVSGDVDGHGGPIFYYLPVVLVGLLPWTGLFLRRLAGVRGDMREPLPRFLWIWFAVVFVFFSLMSTKLPHYVIYGYTPLFVLLAGLVPATRRPVWWLVPAALLLALLLVAPLLLPLAVPHADDATVAGLLQAARAAFGLSYFVALAVGLAAVAALVLVPRHLRWAQVWSVGLIVVIAVNFVLMPRVAEVMQRPVRDAALFARSEGLEVFHWRFNQPSFVFYYGAEVPERIPQPGMVVVTKPHQLPDFPPYRALFEAPGVALVEVSPRE